METKRMLPTTDAELQEFCREASYKLYEDWETGSKYITETHIAAPLTQTDAPIPNSTYAHARALPS